MNWAGKIGGKIRYLPDGTCVPQIASPLPVDKSHISIDRRYRFIRKAAVTSAADRNRSQLRQAIDTASTASVDWKDSAYRSQKNEGLVKGDMLKSRIHCRMPNKRPMSKHMPGDNVTKLAISVQVEHVFVHQKNCYGMLMRAISIARAQAEIKPGNVAHNLCRLIFHQPRATIQQIHLKP